MNYEKENIVDAITYRFSSTWIHRLETEDHWRLYWHQQRIMEGRVRPGQSVLEIGVGSGFTANYLRSRGVHVTMVDIDAEKKPDIVTNIVSFEFNKIYDHILAFQVFEHIPFEKFVEVAKRISSVCTGYLFMSVPVCERVLLKLEYKIPKLRRGKIELTKKRKKIVEPYHFWEVGYGKVTFGRIEDIMSKYGFRQVQRFKVFSRAFSAFKKIQR